jgi:hypothetical protein
MMTLIDRRAPLKIALTLPPRYESRGVPRLGV